VEQGRAEPGHQAHRPVGPRPGSGPPSRPALRPPACDTGQRVRRQGRLCIRPDLRPGHRLGQERPGRGRLRAAHARARHPADLRACITTSPAAASVRWNGRRCGLSASLISCASRPYPQARQRLADPEHLCTGLRPDTSVPPSSALTRAHDPHPPYLAFDRAGQDDSAVMPNWPCRIPSGRCQGCPVVAARWGDGGLAAVQVTGFPHQWWPGMPAVCVVL
jgi:hypothetical protein